MIERPRRLRASQTIRDLCKETSLSTDKMIMGYFICEGTGVRVSIPTMPGIDRVSIDNLLKDLDEDVKLGIKTVLFFGIPDEKDEIGTGAYDDNGIVQRAVIEVKKNFPDLCVVTDVCLCEFTSHGHCGLVENGKVLNDPTLDLLAQTAVSHARAGADIVAPSDMMDGRVSAIRYGLDAAGFSDIPIMSYSAKYASSFYGPFRDAAGSAPQFGDRKTYQMDYRNAREAEREVILDIQEGADIVIVKPALAYLDIIRQTAEISDRPVCAYNVSGEYAMVKLSAQAGTGSEEGLVREILTSIFRAGADMVITYHLRDILKNGWF
jgi:porphobilinogen synthase